ncbi:unnamed protein product [Clavelina lepadiformis]|uniref:Uncharacterized protein n=1 Tax=Clavelina lepadiformis TaxID=159417 RepID=A0ABP0FMV0_CLALP
MKTPDLVGRPERWQTINEKSLALTATTQTELINHANVIIVIKICLAIASPKTGKKSLKLDELDLE